MGPAGEETRLVTCILYHLYTAPLKSSLPHPGHSSVDLIPNKPDCSAAGEGRLCEG